MSNIKDRFRTNEWNMIQDILQFGRNVSWLEMATRFQIKPNGTNDQRKKAANDIWRRFTKITNRDNTDLNTVKQTLDKNGEVVFETKKILNQAENVHPSILEGKRIKKITTNPFGKPWVTYESKPEETQSLTIEEVKQVVQEVLESKYNPKDFHFKNQKIDSSQNSNLTDDLLVYTSDKHIGAKTESNSIYHNEYNAEIFRERMLVIADEIASQGSKDNLVIFDLGDALDGFNGLTTRGGHTLPQNLSNKEQFKTYLEVHKDFFLTILNNGNTYNSIQFVCAANNNHGGDFDFMAMSAFQILLSTIAPNIKVTITDKFIDHVVIKTNEFNSRIKYTVVFTHGKDDKDMKHGLPLVLNEKTENYINNYIDYHKLDTTRPIHFIKGDLHQSSVQYAKRFRYKNVGSIYGSSKWIHTNFGNTKPICDLEVIKERSINEIRLFL